MLYCNLRYTYKALADYQSANNRRLTIGGYRLIQKTIFLSYFKLLKSFISAPIVIRGLSLI